MFAGDITLASGSRDSIKIFREMEGPAMKKTSIMAMDTVHR